MPAPVICADNSIWVRVFIETDEALVEEAFSRIEADVPQVAPALLHYEFSHVLTRYVRNSIVRRADAVVLLDVLMSLKIELLDNDGLHRRALAHSMNYPGLSGYDAQYLSVCEQTGAELWTADKRLAVISQANGIPTRLWVT
jgi:predicted nucleic acid-binding protein